MEVKILKKVSPFLFFLLMIVVTVPGTAQQNVKNEHQQIRKGVNQVHHQRQGNSTHSRFANHGYRNHYTNFRRGNSNVSFSYRNRVVVPANCGPVIQRPNVIRANQFAYGHRVSFLPQNAIRFRGVSRDYFFARGDFYVQGQRGFRSTQIPLGARVSFLPNRARAVMYGRAIYYQLGNVFLAERISRRGVTIYEVVGYV